MSKQAQRLIALSALALFFHAGCDDAEWPESKYIDSLRVLGVQAEPPTLTPGASTHLAVICVDGSRGTTESSACDVEIAWFAQCDNPSGNDPRKCLGQYAKWGNVLDSPLANTAAETYPAGFGFGPTFPFAAPAGILKQEVDVAGSVVRYGTSYVFFAVCAGHLVPVQGASERLPVGCRDRNNGRPLDQRSFVVGVTTIYSYDRIASRNPVLLKPRFDEIEVPDSCSLVSHCPAGFECSLENQCLPVVQHCPQSQSASCQWHCLDFDLNLASFSLFGIDGTPLDAPPKLLWLDHFTNAGRFREDDNGFGLQAPPEPTGAKRTNCIRWQAPSVPTEHAHLWAVVRDNRGGLTSWDQHIIVR